MDISFVDAGKALGKIAPAVLGSFTALLFIRTTRIRKAIYFIAGIGLAKIATQTVHLFTGVSLDAAMYVSAVFGLAIIEKCFDILSHIDAKQVATNLLRRIKG